MTLIQALLIALFGYLSSNYSPWVFGQLGGWYTMGRPLVSGLIIGLILGDVRTGILMGARGSDIIHWFGNAGIIDAG